MLSFPITESSQMTEARRQAVALSRSIGFSEVEQGRVAIVVTELCTNLVKHAQGGELLVGIAACCASSCVDLLALDRGGGMQHVEACMVDGYSTAGSAGTGMGAIRRQSNVFDMFSQSGAGTVAHVRICRNHGKHALHQGIEWAAIARPKPGEEACGDAYSVREISGHFVALVADGLGHGLFAAQASAAAVGIFEQDPSTEADLLVQSIHLGLRATRGAAVAVTSMNVASGIVSYSGIGNIAGSLIERGSPRRMVSLNGTAGHVARHIRSFQYPAAGDTLLVMHSDGIASAWSLDKYPGLTACTPALIAGTIYRDCGKSRDDATVLVARLKS